MTKIQFIMMSCGYVECNYTGVLIYGTNFHGHEGFETGAEAVKELALDLYAKFYDEHMSTYNNRYNVDVKKCCREALIKEPSCTFCSTCGSRLENKPFDAEGFAGFIAGLHGSTCDSYGEAEYANGRNFIWWPWTGMKEFMDASKDSILCIPEQAEVCLIHALAEAKPELFPEEPEIYPYSNDVWQMVKEGKSLLRY